MRVAKKMLGLLLMTVMIVGMVAIVGKEKVSATTKPGKKVWGSFSKVVKIEVVDAATRAHEDRMHEIAAEKYPDLYSLVEDGKLGLTMDDSSNIYFTLGSYEMIDKKENHYNKDIEWIVLDYDEDNGKALLLTRYIVEDECYNNSFTSVTWESESCSLRSWLNETFLYSAFSEKERKNLILQAEVYNSENNSEGINGGNNTKDRIFILSYDEAGKYGNRKTTYFDGSEGTYWLRTPGNDLRTASYVTASGVRRLGKYDVEVHYASNRTYRSDYAIVNGAVDGSGVNDPNPGNWGKFYVCGEEYYKDNPQSGTYSSVQVYGVRPAMWINISQE